MDNGRKRGMSDRGGLTYGVMRAGTASGGVVAPCPRRKVVRTACGAAAYRQPCRAACALAACGGKDTRSLLLMWTAPDYRGRASDAAQRSPLFAGFMLPAQRCFTTQPPCGNEEENMLPGITVTVLFMNSQLCELGQIVRKHHSCQDLSALKPVFTKRTAAAFS